MRKSSESGLTESLRPSRVVVLLDASPDALQALERAAELAGRHKVPLIAISVEEPDYARSAGFPFAQEVGAVSGSIRPIDETLLARRRDCGPSSIRRVIEDVVRGAGVAWELVVVHGHLVEEVLAMSGPGDLLMLGRVGWSARLGRRLGGAPLVLARHAVGSVQICSAEPVRRHGRIAVLVENAGSARTMLTTAAARARAAGCDLLVLLATQADEGEVTQLMEKMGEEAPGWRLRVLQDMNTGELLRTLAEERAVELMVARGGAWLNSPAADRLLTHWRMPVLVMPAG